MPGVIAESEIRAMSTIVENAPCGRSQSGKLQTLRQFRVDSNQMWLWIGLMPASRPRPPEFGNRLPTILDTGCNSSLFISQKHFNFLTQGFSPSEMFPTKIETPSGKIPATLFGNLSLLVYPMDPVGFIPSSGVPTRLFIRDVAVYETKGNTLPLFGLPLFVQNQLHLHVDGGKRRARVIEPGNLGLEPTDVKWQ